MLYTILFLLLACNWVVDVPSLTLIWLQFTCVGVILYNEYFTGGKNEE